MRTPLVAGNWKMNLNLAQMRELVTGIRAGLEGGGASNPGGAGGLGGGGAVATTGVEVAICPPAIYLFPMAKAVAGSSIRLGAQDAFHEPSGAFTGENSAVMVAETGAKYVILGHSERRHTIGHLEDDRIINLKLRAVIAAGMTPILCVGETLGERKANQTKDVITYQLAAGLINAPISSAERLVVAYEPVWAIGTGLNATPEQAQEAHAHLRTRLAELVGPQVAEKVRILYGGSVKPDNAAEIFRQPDVDGGLIGGASLKADSFVGIVRAALGARG